MCNISYSNDKYSIRFLSRDNYRDNMITVQSLEAEIIHGNYEKEK